MLHHVTVEVHPRKIGECAAFYELLGFRQVEPPASLRERAVWLERSRTQVHLLRVEEPKTLDEGHFAVVVEGFEGVLDALRATGHPFERRREHWGSPRAVATDPAGNRVELMAFPP
jgi:catechol 2,3-dioxygenase-like lactoylglutathione lyase family enzyme